MMVTPMLKKRSEFMIQDRGTATVPPELHRNTKITDSEVESFRKAWSGTYILNVVVDADGLFGGW
jgi:hypothetical protein